MILKMLNIRDSAYRTFESSLGENSEHALVVRSIKINKRRMNMSTQFRKPISAKINPISLKNLFFSNYDATQSKY